MLINLAVFQFRPVLGNVERNLSVALQALESLEEGSLVVLPEMWQCGFDYPNLKKHAEATSKVIQEVKRLSKDKSLTVVGSYPLEAEGGIYNSVLIVSEGNIVGVRHKIKLFPLYEEQKHFTPGRENPVFQVKGISVGVLVCFELRFPELSWALREAKVLLVPSMWGAKRKEHLMVLSKARAVENQCFLVLSNCWGRVGEEDFAGCSAVYSPWGEVLAFSEKGDTLLQVKVDLRDVDAVRRLIPVI